LFKCVCEACPHLEKLRVSLHPYDYGLTYFNKLNDGGRCYISTMCKLRTLELFHFDLTSKGLEAILDSCPLLESLHVTGYCLFIMEEMDEDFQVKCARVKNVTLPVRRDGNDYSYDGVPWDLGLPVPGDGDDYIYDGEPLDLGLPAPGDGDDYSYDGEPWDLGQPLDD
jgi:hypothetical protein